MPVLFDHVAVAMTRISDSLPFVAGELGGRYCGGGDAGAFLWRQYRFVGGGVLELLEPSGEPGGFLHRFIDQHGGGVHHVTYKVDDLAASCRAAQELGFSVVGYNDSDPGWMEAFLHPRSAMGIVVQLTSVAGGARDEDTAPLPPPEDDPSPGPPVVTLAGLRLGVTDLERARRLWCTLLGGEADGPARRPTIRWPGSPMRIVLDARVGADGPAAIEVECLHPVLIPQGRHSVLHATIEPVDPAAAVDPPPVDAPARDEDDDGEVYILEHPDP